MGYNKKRHYPTFFYDLFDDFALEFTHSSEYASANTLEGAGISMGLGSFSVSYFFHFSLFVCSVLFIRLFQFASPLLIYGFYFKTKYIP